MKIQIKSILGSLLFEGDFSCLADAVTAAVRASADLSFAHSLVSALHVGFCYIGGNNRVFHFLDFFAEYPGKEFVKYFFHVIEFRFVILFWPS